MTLALCFPTPASATTSSFGAFALKCHVTVGGVKVRPTPAELRALFDHNAVVVVSKEAIQRGQEAHAAAEAKTERFRAFCAEDGIDPRTCERAEEDGRVGIYQPDAMGFPTLVMYKDEL
mgnify:CR=1 FL=1